MSIERQTEIIRALLELREVLAGAVGGVTETPLLRRAQGYTNLASYLLANLTTALGQQYADRVGNDVMQAVTSELADARSAANAQVWSRVLDHSRAMLEALPGDPISYPKRDLPLP
jgi:hypothetical protein